MNNITYVDGVLSAIDARIEYLKQKLEKFQHLADNEDYKLAFQYINSEIEEETQRRQKIRDQEGLPMYNAYLNP